MSDEPGPRPLIPKQFSDAIRDVEPGPISRLAAELPPVTEDDEHAHWFHLGWDAAVREAKLRVDAGQAEAFWHEQRRALEA